MGMSLGAEDDASSFRDLNRVTMLLVISAIRPDLFFCSLKYTYFF